MIPRLLEQLRAWSVLLAGLVVVVGLLVVASLDFSGESVQQTRTAEPAPPAADAQQQQAPPPAETAQQNPPSATTGGATTIPGQKNPQAPAATPQPQAPQQQTAAPQQQPGSGAQTPQPQASPSQTPPPAHAHQPAPQAPSQQQAQSQSQQPASPARPSPQPQSATPAKPAGQAQAAAPAVAGDIDAGKQAFRKCQACHSLDAGKNLIGPSLAGIFGNPAGHVQGYNYSPALKESGVTWNQEALHKYLEAPQKFIPKNKMAFPGLRLESERANVIAFLASSSGAQAQPSAPPQQQAQQEAAPQTSQQQPAQQQAQPRGAVPEAARPVPPPAQAQQPDTSRFDSVGYIPDVRFTLRSGIAEGRMVFIGVGGTIDGAVNPILSAAAGQTVQLTLLNGEGAEHDIVFPDQNAASPRITGRGTSTTIVFRATKAGDFVYYCDVPGHRQAGMEGQFIVTPRPAESVTVEADISQQPTEVPPAIGTREPQTVRVDLVAVELEARLAEGTTYGFWTFNGRVPGPMLRARVGDTIDVHVSNAENSSYIHSVDLHAVTGPGGGAVSTQVDPGHAKSFKFKAMVPGLYVYHCATPMVAHHITNGMYGLILVEPEGGLPPVDREFYVMQGEIYTDAAFGQQGRQEFSVEKLLNERPEYFVFNGSVGAISKLHPLKAKVGETVRIFFGVGGPNATSSFHVIGEIFDRVYSFADVLSPPLRGVQTITVPPGGATIVEFKVDVPGDYTLVDHALSRAERGLIGILQVEGPPNPEIFDGKVESGVGH